MSSLTEFTQSVWRLLPTTQPDVAESITREIKLRHVQGWTVYETAQYLRCMEEITPELDEATALARMKRIQEEVQQRIKRPLW